jgi:hypothetical protein
MENQEIHLNNKEVNSMIQDNLLRISSLRNTLFNFKRETIEELSLSETMSLYLHLPKKYYDHFDIRLSRKLNSREAISIALIVNHLDPLLKYSIILELEKLCYDYQYEGKWNICNTIIQLSEDVEKLFYFLEIEKLSERELFGNYLRQFGKVLSERIIFSDRRNRKVKKPQRKRGYNDHGSRRPAHKWLPDKISNSENPEKEDLRKSLTINRDTLQVEERIPGSSNQTLPRKEELS